MRKLFLFAVLNVLFHIPCTAQGPQLTNLPTVYITTQNNAAIVDKTTWVPGTLEIVSGDTYPGRDLGPVEIRGRGNSTWLAPKKPYRIRLPRNTPSNLLGMPSNARNWVLLASYFDNTLIRNALAFEVGQFLGFAYTPAYRFVDVVLNGQYIGNYTLTDHVQVENNRVSVEALAPADQDPEVITGGYFVQEELYAEGEAGYFQTSHAHRYDVKYPDSDDINSAQRTYIRNYIQNYEDRLYSSNFLDPVLGYNAVVDRTSQVNWQISNELTANQDAYLSVYLYKKRSDPKLYFGPMWDYDRAFDNSDRRQNMAYIAVSEVEYNTGKISKMLQDPDFINALKTRWKSLRANGLYEALDNKITDFAQAIEASQQANFQLSNIAPQPVSPAAYQDLIAELRRFLKRKIAYLDYHLTRELDPGRYYKIGEFAERRLVSSGTLPSPGLSLAADHPSGHLQDWLFVPAGSGHPGYVKIKNRENGLFLTQNGTNLQLNTQNAGDAYDQLWRIDGVPGQSYAAIIGHPQLGTKVLARSGGGLTLSSDLNVSSSTSRRWFFVSSDLDESSLPVQISAFRVSPHDDGIVLDWTVTEASNFSHFEIQRTQDPASPHSKTIGHVYLRDQSTGRYQFLDRAPEFGLNYYRMKMVDLDGSHRHSDYRSQAYSGIATFSTFPVPTNSEANVSFESRAFSGIAQAQLYTSLGAVVRSESIQVAKGSNKVAFDVKGLPPGVYLMTLRFGNELKTSRIVVGP